VLRSEFVDGACTQELDGATKLAAEDLRSAVDASLAGGGRIALQRSGVRLAARPHLNPRTHRAGIERLWPCEQDVSRLRARAVELIFGAGKIDRRIADVEVLLRDWREKERDWGQLYLEYKPTTPRDRLLVEDLAVTMLINSRVAAQAATSVYRHGATVELRSLPEKALGETTDSERQVVAEVVSAMASWPWLGASTASKTLHKKRPALIPILDNMAIFGGYMNELWPEKRALADTVKAVSRIKEALDWIAVDVTRPENEAVWARLEEIEPTRSRIELFDMVWWMYFAWLQAGSAGCPSSAEIVRLRGEPAVWLGAEPFVTRSLLAGCWRLSWRQRSSAPGSPSRSFTASVAECGKYDMLLVSLWHYWLS